MQAIKSDSDALVVSCSNPLSNMNYDYSNLWFCLPGALLIGSAAYRIAKIDITKFGRGECGSDRQDTAVLIDGLFRIVLGMAFITGGIVLLLKSTNT